MYKLLFIGILFLLSTSHAVTSLSQEEQAIASRFLRLLFEESEGGYVYHNVKPLSANGYMSDPALIPHFPRQQEEAILRLGSRVWRKLRLRETDFCLTIAEQPSSHGDVAVNVLRRGALTKIINNHLDLFRYVLGPTITASSLANRIIAGEESYEEILKNDRVLIGLVLGYGVGNSELHNYLENIRSITWKGFSPPYRPYSADTVLKSLKGSGLSPEEYIGLAYRRDSSLQKLTGSAALAMLNQVSNWSQLRGLMQCTPGSLQDSPAPFVCGLRSDEPGNQEFTTKLIQTQQVVRQQLHQTEAWESVLGELSQGALSSSDDTILLPIVSDDIDWVVARVIWNTISTAPDETRQLWIKGFSKKFDGAPRGVVRAVGLDSYERFQQAQKDLNRADTAFAAFPSDAVIRQGELAYSIITPGRGDPLTGAPRACMDLSVATADGKVVYAESGVEVELAACCPGFTHGVQDMLPGERRKIYVHPALGYGYIGSGLGIEVLVFDVTYHSHSHTRTLPDLEPIDLSVLRDSMTSGRMREATNAHAQRMGSKVADWLSLSDDLCLTNVMEHLNALHTKSRRPAPLANNDRDAFDRVIWNISYPN